jgi:malate synthase
MLEANIRCECLFSLLQVVDEELQRVRQEVGAARFDGGRYKEAAYMFARQCTAAELDDFLTLDAYRRVVEFTLSSRL